MPHDPHRNRPALLAILGCALAATPAAGQEERPAPETGRRSLLLAPGEETPLALPLAAQLDTIAAATATDRRRLTRCTLHTQSGAGGADLTIARVPIPDEAALAVIALTADGSFAGAAITDPDGAVLEEWQHFVEGLVFHDVPRLAGARPRAHLAARREHALAHEGDVDAQLTVALLDLMAHMQEQAAAFNLPRDPDRDRAAEWRAASGAYAAVAALAEPLAPVLDGATEEFAQLARSSAAAAAQLATATADRDRDGMRTHRRTLTRNCKTCHELPAAGRELKEVTAAKRRRLGIGDGFYQIGHDLRIRHPDRARTQQVADALRIGALLIDAARTR